MQFKSLAFLSILSILFFTGCDTKDTEKESSTTNSKKEVKPFVPKKTEYTFTTLDNKQIELSLKDEKITIKGTNKVVLINFFATWCPPCKAEIPILNEFQKKYSNDIEVISILVKDKKTIEQLQTFKKDFKMNYKILTGKDSNLLAKTLGIKSIPTMYLLDKDSNIFQKYRGLVPKEMLEIDIKKALMK